MSGAFSGLSFINIDNQSTINIRNIEPNKIWTDEKNYTLIRFDIVNGFKNLSVHLNDEEIKLKALKLIKLEEEIKYRKKYTRIWNEKRR